MKTARLFLTVVALIVTMAPFAYGQKQAGLPAQYWDKVPASLKERIKRQAGHSTFIMAEALGMKEIMGKSLKRDKTTGGSRGKSSLLINNVGIGVHPLKSEEEPTVVVNPKNKSNLVAGSHFSGEPAPFENRCVAYNSFDGGRTWSAPILMPHLDPLSFASDPVLAFAPDGKRVYYAYMDIKGIVDFGNFTFTEDLDIVVSFSDDGGVTWQGPIVALNGAPTVYDLFTFDILVAGFIYDKPWIGTHALIGDKRNTAVYVTASRFDNFAPFEVNIAFTRSLASGKAGSWSPAKILDSSNGDPVIVVQGSRPTGGKNGDVLVAWYHSGTDGWLEGSFEIRTRYSPDYGKTWQSIRTAVVDNFEAPFFLGPDAFYHRWWLVMFPDVEIDQAGKAHIAYTHDPAENPIPGISDTAEDGDIRYITSKTKPYSSWSTPRTLNNDGLVRAQGMVALEARGDEKNVHFIWNDHRSYPEVITDFPFSSNLFYDIFYTTIGKSGNNVKPAPNRRITTAPSINDFIFIGDYNDLAMCKQGNSFVLFAAFTDRRDKLSIFDSENDVFGIRITPDGVLKEQEPITPETVPTSFTLDQNYPNPFNPSTNITYHVAAPTEVTIQIFDLNGQLVRTLVSEPQQPGAYTVTWNGKNRHGKTVASGVYIYRFTAGDYFEQKRMTFLK